MLIFLAVVASVAFCASYTRYLHANVIAYTEYAVTADLFLPEIERRLKTQNVQSALLLCTYYKRAPLVQATKRMLLKRENGIQHLDALAQKEEEQAMELYYRLSNMGSSEILHHLVRYGVMALFLHSDRMTNLWVVGPIAGTGMYVTYVIVTVYFFRGRMLGRLDENVKAIKRVPAIIMDH